MGNLVYISVDVETDGQAPGCFSMIEVGAVVVRPPFDHVFRGMLSPISTSWDPAALEVSMKAAGYADVSAYREATLRYPHPIVTMTAFADWVADAADRFGSSEGPARPVFLSDSGFDWMFVCWYFHAFTDGCPFGHSSVNLGSLAKGLDRSMFSTKHKKYRETAHDHDSVNDAKGNAEAFVRLAQEFSVKGIL